MGLGVEEEEIETNSWSPCCVKCEFWFVVCCFANNNKLTHLGVAISSSSGLQMHLNDRYWLAKFDVSRG